MADKFWLDAHGTDGSDPAQMTRHYYDGTVQPADQPEIANTGWDRLEGLPGWATWDTQQAVDYINAEVTDLATAKQVMVAQAKMLIAIRDFLLPHLDKDRS